MVFRKEYRKPKSRATAKYKIQRLLFNRTNQDDLKAPDKIQKLSVTQHATKSNPEKSKPTCRHCKKPAYYRTRCRQLKKEKYKTGMNRSIAGNNCNNSGQTISDAINKKAMLTTQTIEMTGTRKPATHLVRPVAKSTSPQRNAFLEPM